MGYDHWYKQREDELKALKCGTKTYGLAEEEQGWVWVNKLKAKQVHKKGITFTCKFPLVDFKISYVCIFLANADYV